MNRNRMGGDFLSKPGIKVVFEFGELILSKSGNFVGKGYSCHGMIKLCTNDNFNKVCKTQEKLNFSKER